MKQLICIVLAGMALLFQPGYAQDGRYRNLVLEGGGIRGFAYAGAFEILDSLQLLDDIERVGGTSAGAIQATLLAVGYTPREIMEIAQHVPLRKFNDGGFFRGFRRLKKQFGWHKGQKMSEWIEGVIAAKTGNGNITFAELYRDRQAKGYKALYITGTDLTYQCIRVFSHESYPDMRIKDAVRISASIPIYFGAVLMDDQGKVYEQRDSTRNWHVMADGGVLSNYPLFLFDSTRFITGMDTLPNRFMENPETLGLMMEMPEQIAFNRQQPGNHPFTIHTMRDYLKALYSTLIDKPNPDYNGHSTLRRTVAISNLNISGRIRKISRETVEGFVASGREGVRQFFREEDVWSRREGRK